VNNFEHAALAPQDPQKIYAVARVNVAFVIAPDFYLQVWAAGAPAKCILPRHQAKAYFEQISLPVWKTRIATIESQAMRATGN